MAASSRHAVRVQKARSASRRTEAARLPIRELSLARRAKRLDHEPWQVPPRPNPKPRDGYEGHKPMIPPRNCIT
jgi:hypothetical protein